MIMPIFAPSIIENEFDYEYFSRDAGSSINLGMLLDGEYTIEVIIDGVAYEGTFYL